MTAKRTTASIILSVFIAIMILASACNKNNNNVTATTATAIYANIDSMTGTYTGITSGDSIYTYTDSNGHTQQWVHSFSLADTIVITSPDTINISVASKLYTASFPYGDSLTVTYVNATTAVISTATVLQSTIGGQNTSFTDTAGGVNHVIINVGYTGTKSIGSNVTLLHR